MVRALSWNVQGSEFQPQWNLDFFFFFAILLYFLFLCLVIFILASYQMKGYYYMFCLIIFLFYYVFCFDRDGIRPMLVHSHFHSRLFFLHAEFVHVFNDISS